MSGAEFLYLLPYIGSLALSAGVTIYAWQRRRAKGVMAYALYATAQTTAIFGFIAELISPDLSSKIFWDGFQWLSSLAFLVIYPVFVTQYAEVKLKNPRSMFALSLIAPGLSLLILATDVIHHWVYPDPRLIPAHPFSELDYTFSGFVIGFALYGYCVIGWGISVLARRILRPHSLFRAQTAIIIIGFLIPVLGTILALFDIRLTPQRDPTPFTLVLANLIVAYGLFRFRLFTIVPIGRDRLFESLVDPVVILDNRQNIVDINESMLALLSSHSDDVIGKAAKEVFNNFPIPIKSYTHVSHARAEATFELNGRSVHYELTIWPLYDNNKTMVGRIYVSHDITALKELERELRELNLDLEQRVRSRTRELAEAYDVTLEGWAKALELRDKETEGHSRRVTETTLQVARALGFKEEELEHVRRGAILHDIGKMGIPDHILRKKGELTAEERQVVLKHPQTAYELLRQIPFLEKALDIPYCHHEKWDGSGYPRGLKELEIPLSARIFAVVDVWDALTTDRPYRKALQNEEAVQYLISEAGRHFDPRVVNAYLGLIEKGEI
jgi:putative nucleotidyltransferase with HDIG domain/PAS domain S-box-containing protein